MLRDAKLSIAVYKIVVILGRIFLSDKSQLKFKSKKAYVCVFHVRFRWRPCFAVAT